MTMTLPPYPSLQLELVSDVLDASKGRVNHAKKPFRAEEIVDLTVKFAQENPTWGYDRSQGELAKVGYHICDSTVSIILKSHGIEPAPTRKQTGSWATFLKAYWGVMAAIDFTTVEVWTKSGLVTFYVLFIMELKPRRVHFAGCTTSPNEDWMKQATRELTNCEDGFLNDKQYLIMDRDTKFCESFRSILSNAGVEPKRQPLRAHT